MTTRTRRHSKQGDAFTLLELLLVLLLVGISVGAIVPHLGGSISNWQLKESVKNIQAALRLASQWATTRQEITMFVLDPQAGSFYLKPFRDGSSPAEHPFPVGRQSLGKDVQIIRVEGFKDVGKEKVMAFWPDGKNDTITIVLGCRAAATRQTQWHITLDEGGAVHLQQAIEDQKDG